MRDARSHLNLKGGHWLVLQVFVLLSLNVIGAPAEDGCSKLFTISPQGKEISVPPQYILDGGLQIPVVSDVHGNLEGLFRAVADLQVRNKRRYPIVFITGDLAFYPYLNRLTPEQMAREFLGQNDFGVPQYFETDQMYRRFYSGDQSFRSLVAKFYFVRGNHDDTNLLRKLNELHSREVVGLDTHGVLNYLTDGSLIRLKWEGQTKSVQIASYGGISGESRPKAFAREPGLAFDEDAGIELLTEISKNPEDRPAVLLTHQGLENMPSGHSAIDAFCELVAPQVHICGHGHREAGPVLSGPTRSYELRDLGRDRRPNLDEGRVLMLNIRQDGRAEVVKP